MNKKNDDTPLVLLPGLALIVFVISISVGLNCKGHRPQDACGGSGSRPVTIANAIVIGCR